MKIYVKPTILVRALSMESLLAGSEKYLPFNQDTSTKDAFSKVNEIWED